MPEELTEQEEAALSPVIEEPQLTPNQNIEDIADADVNVKLNLHPSQKSGRSFAQQSLMSARSLAESVNTQTQTVKTEIQSVRSQKKSLKSEISSSKKEKQSAK